MARLLLIFSTAVITSVNAWWKPAVGTTWQIQLSQPLTAPYPNVTAFDFDLFDNPASTVQAIHAKQGKAICYFSAGSWENWRSDAGEFPAACIGKPLDGWPGEKWLNTSCPEVRTIMTQRMDLAVQKGCDAIDPDNLDCYDNGGGGFGLTQADAINYVQFLSSEGHSRGLAVSLKNAGAIIPKVLSDVDFAVNEQCLQYNECSVTRPFITAGKPVFEIEYRSSVPTAQQVNAICSNPTRKSFSTLIKHMSLNAWYIACPSILSTSSTPTETSSSSSTVQMLAASTEANAAHRITSGSWIAALGFSFVLLGV